MKLRTGRSKGLVALTVVTILLIGCGGGGSSGPAPKATSSASTSNASQTTNSAAQSSTPPAPEPLQLNLAASPEHIERGGISTLSWDATPATRCTATGGWQGDQPVSGVYTVGPVDATTSFDLSCEDAEASGRERVIVTVVSRMLRWNPPTHNVDGSPLTDLAGYVVYWGLESISYTDSYRIEASSATEWLLDVPPGTYYIAMTAFDSEGNESALSNEILKIVR